MEPRLSSHVLASALLRLAEREGGFGAVLAKGDPDSGAMTVLLLERGVRQILLERVSALDGGYAWRELGNRAAQNDRDFAMFLERSRRIDPDLWLIELDVPSAERFADEMRSAG
jgi:hypothetical protein